MPKRPWIELSIRLPFEFVEPAAELFRRYGKGGVAIEEAGGYNPDEGEGPPSRQSAIVRTYMPQTAAFRVNREMVHIGIQLIGHITDLPPMEEREIREEEWEAAWKAHFTPLRIGERLLVQPPWHRDSVTPDDVVVEIDPGMAFGTGHHPTTYRVLHTLQLVLPRHPRARVVDVGAGSGILSIAAVKLGARSVTGIEIDKVAAKAGRGNIRANRVGRRARLLTGTLPNPDIPPGEADLVLANINSVVLVKMAVELRRLLKPGGEIIASGVLQERRQSVVDAFGEAGLGIRQEFHDDDWVTLLASAGPEPA
ncbi:MAG: 50S ribosomal protein L11 methyltransferase [SAR202 cluster bacterium]|nr:50S ribosomal protein L11 methyltransferase [SAR202 cluster bacterium]